MPPFAMYVTTRGMQSVPGCPADAERWIPLIRTRGAPGIDRQNGDAESARTVGRHRDAINRDSLTLAHMR